MKLEYFDKIDDVSPLSVFFNKTMDKLAALRKLCAPVSFLRNEEIADFQDKAFCNLCRYEYWMHQVVGRLYRWKIDTEEYFSEDFDSSVLQRIKDSVLGEGDIVAETLPYDIWSLCKDILSQARIGVLDSLRVVYGCDVKTYRMSEEGTPIPMTREDIELIDVERQVEAEDDTKRLMAIAGGITAVVQTIHSLGDKDFKEEDIMIMIHRMAESLLMMDFKRAETVLKDWRETHAV